MTWEKISDDDYIHCIHFKHGLAKKFDNLCKESTEYIFSNLNEKEKESMLKEYLFREMREQSSPKELFTFLVDSDANHLIEKHNITPNDFNPEKCNRFLGY